MTQQGFAESDSSSNIYTTEGLRIKATESPPQAQQRFAEPTPNNYVQHMDSAQKCAKSFFLNEDEGIELFLNNYGSKI